MTRFYLRGGAPLYGDVHIHGAKNSILPVLCASLLGQGQSTIDRCPQISDAHAAISILRCLGADAEQMGERVTVAPDGANRWEISQPLMAKMRASVIFLGALLARFGRGELYMPGGCVLGARPIDYHIAALQSMGVTLREEGEKLLFSWKNPQAGDVVLPFPSVGATQNVILAATAVSGETVLHGAATEPEVEDLCRYLCAMGGEIAGIGTRTLVIHGGKPLKGTAYSVLPDRIETATYLAACAACGGKMRLLDTCGNLLQPVLSVLRQAGCNITEEGSALTLECSLPLRAVGKVTTAPYPGFPTDAQPPILAALLRAKGESVFEETVFLDRFRHGEQLQKFGAELQIQGNRAVVRGVKTLSCARVQATDLRGGAAAVIAALQAEGESIIENANYIGRGYADFTETLRRLGADVREG